MNNIFLNKASLLIGIFFGIVFIYFLLTKMLVVFLPFVVAYFLSKIIQKPVTWLNRHLKFPRSLATLLCLVIFLSIAGSLLYTLAQFLVNKLVYYAALAPYAINEFNAYSQMVMARLEEINASIGLQLTKVLNDNLTILFKNISTFLGNFAKDVILKVASLPSLFLFLMITMISAFFMTKDATLIRTRLFDFFNKHQLNPGGLLLFQRNVFSALIGYLRAQGILMTVTFTISFIGLHLIGIKHPALLALLVACVDALPILGPATVYVPWAITRFIIADLRTGVLLLFLYLCVTITRQMIEPKVVGKQIGIYPLVTLMAMYSGLKIFGALGLILGPLTVITVKTIYEANQAS